MDASPKAVLETSLYVSDLERAVAFYESVLGLRRIENGYFAGGRGAALQVGAGHVAFRVDPEDLPEWRKRLRDCGVTIEKEFAFEGQPPSVYFRDPDGNSLELAVSSIWGLSK